MGSTNRQTRREAGTQSQGSLERRPSCRKDPPCSSTSAPSHVPPRCSLRHWQWHCHLQQGPRPLLPPVLRPVPSASPGPPSPTSTATRPVRPPRRRASCGTASGACAPTPRTSTGGCPGFRDAWTYRDLYAVYRDDELAREHPEWILHDAAGRKLYIPFDCGGGTCTQYAGDIGDPAFRAHWIAEASDQAARYRGIFVDDVNLEPRVSNGQGDQVMPLDPRTGRTMTESDWRRYIAEFTEQIGRALPDKEIVHNSLWFAGHRDPSVQRAAERRHPRRARARRERRRPDGRRRPVRLRDLLKHDRLAPRPRQGRRSIDSYADDPRQGRVRAWPPTS